ncbi:MAG: recombinase RecA [bacterium]
MAVKKGSPIATIERQETDEGKRKALESALKMIKRKHGEGSIMRIGDGEVAKIETISTGSFSLDRALGIGGIPRGRVTEIYGPEASGKTTLALHIIAEAQKQGDTAAFIDAEHALDPAFARRIGVNIEDLYLSQPDYGEQALDIAETLILSGAVGVVVVDSVAALVPRAELDGTMDDLQVGLQARLMAKAMRKLTALVSRTKTALVFVNQTRANIGGYGYAPTETTTGGRALKFTASVRLDIRKFRTIKEKDTVLGNTVKVKVAKNKLAPPFRVATFDIMFDEGISREGEILDIAEKLKIVSKKGAYYYYEDVALGQGRENAKRYLKENPDLAKEIEGKIVELGGVELFEGEVEETPPEEVAAESQE